MNPECNYGAAGRDCPVHGDGWPTPDWDEEVRDKAVSSLRTCRHPECGDYCDLGDCPYDCEERGRDCDHLDADEYRLEPTPSGVYVRVIVDGVQVATVPKDSLNLDAIEAHCATCSSTGLIDTLPCPSCRPNANYLVQAVEDLQAATAVTSEPDWQTAWEETRNDLIACLFERDAALAALDRAEAVVDEAEPDLRSTMFGGLVEDLRAALTVPAATPETQQ